MMTRDPQLRTERLDQLHRALATERAGFDQDLLSAFVTAVFVELPDAFLLDPTPEALARRLLEAFNFVVHTVPPAFQMYKNAPGLHVEARNPDTEDVTILQTHTPHVPFIFESLKSYFHQQGLRVLSSIHPLMTVQRRWEQIVRIGDSGDEGARELYCQFRIERVESPERLRRIEHEVHAVLKSIFLAVEDFPAMWRDIHELEHRLREGGDEPARADEAKAFLQWLIDDNFVFFGALAYQPATRGELSPAWASARGVFRDRNILPVVFPGLIERYGSYRRP